MVSRLIQILIVLFCFSILILFTFVPHSNYPFPIHNDEWYHIFISQVVFEHGLKTNPHFPTYTGFYIILIGLGQIFDLVHHFFIFPILLNILIGLLIYVTLTYYFSWQYGALGVLLVSTIKSNANVLGLWFFTPHSVGILFMGVIIILTSYLLRTNTYTKKEKNVILVILLMYAILIFIHPSSALLVGSVTLLYLSLFRIKFILRKLNLKHFFYSRTYVIITVLVGIFILYGVYLYSLHYMTYFSFKKIFSLITWNIATVHIPYNIVTFFGIFLFIFSIGGIFHAYTENKMRFEIFFIVCNLINIYIIFPLFSITFFSAYQRIFYNTLIVLTFFGAIGIMRTFYSIKTYIQSKQKAQYLYFLYGLYFIFIVVIFFVAWSEKLQSDEFAPVYYLILEEDIEALEFLSSLTPKRQFGLGHPTRAQIMNPYQIGLPLAVLSNMNPFAKLFYSNIDEIKRSVFFYEADCDEKRKYMNHHYYLSLELIYSYGEIQCDFLKEIYNTNDIFIYAFVQS